MLLRSLLLLIIITKPWANISGVSIILAYCGYPMAFLLPKTLNYLAFKSYLLRYFSNCVYLFEFGARYLIQQEVFDISLLQNKCNLTSKLKRRYLIIASAHGAILT
jgi:hypothetical protein